MPQSARKNAKKCLPRYKKCPKMPPIFFLKRNYIHLKNGFIVSFLPNNFYFLLHFYLKSRLSVQKMTFFSRKCLLQIYWALLRSAPTVHSACTRNILVWPQNKGHGKSISCKTDVCTDLRRAQRKLKKLAFLNKKA